MKKSRIIIIALLFLSLIILYFYPKNYDETFEGVYYQLGNSDLLEPVIIELKGITQNHITGRKSFEGEIDIQVDEEMIFPDEWDDWQISLPNGGPGNLFSETKYGKENFMNWYSAGWVYTNKKMDQFSIMLYEKKSDESSGSWSGEDGFLITFPAMTREEALKISDELITSFTLDGDIFRVKE
ncbi:hypothetical protein [Ornithinibacillus halotolerans]|uniref:Uncharacterized protein n=1 Tax=Ornithinibacillus halotolerans TaxID=1274357 RepID=A0A916RR46_9BACI|nr:hypothetical protein [Ornithinibacillus halotolerans]GGA65659.1 hypothetical protein GCM10008025_06820 [Ornithinibacillus halotolerans]